MISSFLQAQIPIANLLSSESRTSFTVHGVGARAMGIGNAFIAVADDATAISFNPAGLAQLVRPEMSFVGQWSQRELEFKGFRTIQDNLNLTLSDSSTSDASTQPMFTSLSIPFRLWGRNTVFEISNQRLFDMNQHVLRTPTLSNPQGQSVAIAHIKMNQRGRMDLKSAGLAMELTPRILVGLSMNWWRGDWVFDLNVNQAGIHPGEAQETRVWQENIFRGQSWSGGLIWRSEEVNLGFVYRAPFMADYALASSYENSKDPSGDFRFPRMSMRLRWPETLGAGIAYRPHSRWLLAADWSRTRWSQASFDLPTSSINAANFFDLRVDTQTPDVNSRRFGLEFIPLLREKLLVPIRAGAFIEPQPDVDPVTGEQRVLKGWTLGTGIRYGNWSFDLAYKSSRGSRSSSEYTQLEEAGPIPDRKSLGWEEEREQRLFFSIIYQFKNEGMDNLLRWLLVGD